MKWIKDHLGVILVTLLLFVLSPVFTEILPNHQLGMFAKATLVLGNLALAGIAATTDIRRLAASRKLGDIDKELRAEQESKLEDLGRRGLTLQRSLERISEAIATLRGVLEDGSSSQSELQRAASRQEAVKTCLKELCDVLLADSRAPADDPLKPTYFKATFFEYDSDQGEAGKLVRKYWHYPSTIAPRTPSWDLVDDPNSAAVLAFRTRQEVALPDVQKAFMEGSRWKDGRAGQHAEYAQSSMLCVPIWREASIDPSIPPVRGVLTVDTNQLGYFQEGETNRASRAMIFGPFLGLVRLVYLLTDSPTISHGASGQTPSELYPAPRG